ncbi:response regulator [Garciella nitratireducens]|uniref:response regulator n=1 Tax=Garciella nitratireducens TaxID=218205 RepID=UPI001BD4D305|nr:response regulator [Garciella nitratireducens]
MINVLIIEDDPMVAQINQKFVNSVEGFSVVDIAANGQEALFSIENKKIDLIILDIYMPKLDGIAFLKKMRKTRHNIDVIAITASKEADIIDQVLKLGAVDYLVKPFEYERLKKSLDHYKIRFRLLKKNPIIKQEDIDKITNGFLNQSTGIPKGLQKKTLEKIRSFLKEHKGQSFSSEEIAKNMDISRVTVRRYLEFLESTGEILLEIEYGSIGRPTNLYQYKGL